MSFIFKGFEATGYYSESYVIGGIMEKDEIRLIKQTKYHDNALALYIYIVDILWD